MEGEIKKERTLKQLKQEKSLEEFNKFAKEVTELYANSNVEHTQKVVARDNSLTQKCLRSVMDYAICANLVSLETAIKIQEKAAMNQKNHSSEAGITSRKHHRELISIRSKNIAATYSKEQIVNIAIDVAKTSKSLVQIASKYKMESVSVLRQVLQRAIIESIISDEMVEEIEQRSIAGNTNPHVDVEGYFLRLRNERENYKKGALS